MRFVSADLQIHSVSCPVPYRSDVVIEAPIWLWLVSLSTPSQPGSVFPWPVPESPKNESGRSLHRGDPVQSGNPAEYGLVFQPPAIQTGHDGQSHRGGI